MAHLGAGYCSAITLSRNIVWVLLLRANLPRRNESSGFCGVALPPIDIVIQCPNIDKWEQSMRCVGGREQYMMEMTRCKIYYPDHINYGRSFLINLFCTDTREPSTKSAKNFLQKEI